MAKKPPPLQSYEFMGRKKPASKRPVAGRDTRPTEREIMSGIPRKRKPIPKPDSRMRMPKELESMYPRRKPQVPKNRPRKPQPKTRYGY